MIKRQNIQIRDPFILPVVEEGKYYLYGTTDKDPWLSSGVGFDVYRSKDLENWEGPFEVFRPQKDFWADKNFWAPEVHVYKGRYYMFSSFSAVGRCRGTQILVSNSPLGPFIPHTDGPVTPQDWDCLDGTLFVDDNQCPWMVFCHEWTQVGDGQMCAFRLSPELDRSVGDPIELFTATQAPWVRMRDGEIGFENSNGFVTDGPFMYRAGNGELLMLWSSFSEDGYSIGTARAQSGGIRGLWVHDSKPLYSRGGGHAMLFEAFDGQLMLSFHRPNITPDERPCFLAVEESDGLLEISKWFCQKFYENADSNEAD